MTINIICFVVGIFVGVGILDYVYQQQEKKTLSQLNSDMCNDLVKYKNLSESLLGDVNYWRARYHTLRKAIGNE